MSGRKHGLWIHGRKSSFDAARMSRNDALVSISKTQTTEALRDRKPLWVPPQTLVRARLLRRRARFSGQDQNIRNRSDSADMSSPFKYLQSRRLTAPALRS